MTATRQMLKEMSGGFGYDCAGDVDSFLEREDVRAALHLGEAKGSRFDYTSSGPASVTLWPELAKKLRVLIYNGDVRETKSWAPWFTSNRAAPAGYVTRYQAPEGAHDFSFQTIRLSGHMVPTFQPEAGFVMIKDFF